MLKSFIFIISVFIYSSYTLASDPNILNTRDGADAHCASCEKDSLAQKIPAAVFAAEYLKRIDKPFNCENGISSDHCLLIDWLKFKSVTYSKNCKDFFMHEDGTIGDFSEYLGRLMFDDVQKNGEKSMFLQTNPDFEKYCPEYKSFDIDQKIAFHGWIFELTAFPENNCSNKNSVVKGVYSMAACMFQLNYPRKDRYWRSNGFDVKRCDISEKEILTTEGCIGCAFDEYKRKVIKDGTPFGVFNSAGKKVSGSYWASQNRLSQADEKCLESTYTKGPKPMQMKDKKSKPLYLTKCKGANWEWVPRYKFFRRLQRFPLCKSRPEAQKEVTDLEVYLKTKIQK